MTICGLGKEDILTVTTKAQTCILAKLEEDTTNNYNKIRTKKATGEMGGQKVGQLGILQGCQWEIIEL